MDPKLLAALNALTRADFKVMYGSSDLAERLYNRWLQAKQEGSLLLFALGLTENQKMELSLLLKLKLEEEVIEVKGSYWTLHKLLTWAYSERHSFFIKVAEEPVGHGEADFSILVSRKSFDQFQSIKKS